ncbi:hypothetical protein ACGFRG_08010 [Streptomyces sp. NPDC048696]|uniref:hypothetical protein n=1 Tax=Streptomyces sp. NPDC048696 TaxID=3365585 RepID=UPI003720626D
MATSAVPRVVDALVALFRAVPSLTGVQVIDGPPLGDMADADLIAIGWDPTSDLAAEFTQSFNAAGARTRDEDISITGWAESWTGDTDVAARRRRAFELLAAIEAALRATDTNQQAPTLGGTVLWAHLTRGVFQQMATDRGVRAGIAFTITCRARI